MNIFKLVFFPLILGFWLFRLPWIIYFAVAGAVGYFAYLEYENYRFNVFEAEFNVVAGVPDPTPLSEWDMSSDVTLNDELNIQGLYFSELSQGSFTPLGTEKAFILLADERGREIKVALVVRPAEISTLRRSLEDQGTGNSIPVTVNGFLIRNRIWAESMESALTRMNIPRADNFVLIEPILGHRETFIHRRAEDSIGSALVLGALAGALAFYGVIRFLISLGGARKTTTAQAANRKRAAGRSKQPTQKPVPAKKSAEASPWGTFKPQDDNIARPPAIPPNQAPDVRPKPATSPASAKRLSPPTLPRGTAAMPTAPDFKSVFPGGGSSFKFKTADQIIRQSFGTLSTTRANARALKHAKQRG